ncbi:hypothetical protein [Anabaena sp. UHCC 0399]|uniref:hypothetical protein n=1 Tax=Anabaena sp. UHCC 0399 TaxID=3110238 RepID=UPI002B220D3B|nr:hypothetical protein [Anabaena sp. UHCC 0399]MEA5567247.1 hypothetical protein [Anabaena sp. UHCC 0399]
MRVPAMQGRPPQTSGVLTIKVPISTIAAIFFDLLSAIASPLFYRMLYTRPKKKRSPNNRAIA